MLNVVLHSDVGELTVVVTRYFGGILLLITINDQPLLKRLFLSLKELSPFRARACLRMRTADAVFQGSVTKCGSSVAQVSCIWPL